MTVLDLTPGGGAAPLPRRVLAQAGLDARAVLRNGEQLLLTLVLPVLLLVGLAGSPFPDLGPGRRIDVLAPGVLALAVLSTAFTGQAIATGFDRRYGVLRMLATTPLGRGGLIAGRVLAVLAVEVLQVAVLGGLAVALGWRPAPVGVLLAAPALVLGTVTFVAAGLLLAGTLRSEAVLAGANLAWVLLVALGGVLVPTALMREQAGGLGGLARWLPSGALGDLLRATLGQGRPDLVAVAVLLAWGSVAALAAVRWFRWD
jgi:ABC-2 type transport system permease protein